TNWGRRKEAMPSVTLNAIQGGGYSPDRGIEDSLRRTVLPWGEARRRECIQGDTRPTEQRSPRAKRPLPEGLRRFWLVASLFVGSQSAAAMLPSSRLATSQKRQQQTVFYPAVWCVGV